MDRIADWPTEIARGIMIGQHVMEVDYRGLWPQHFPRVAATPEQIADLESVLGFALDPCYRGFLLAVNGWVNFYQEVTLFGVEELTSGTLHDLAQEELLTLDEAGALERVGLTRGELMPIAASEEQIDLFVMDIPSSPHAGRVSWLAGDLIEQRESFDEYYLASLEYNWMEFKDLEREFNKYVGK